MNAFPMLFWMIFTAAVEDRVRTHAWCTDKLTHVAAAAKVVVAHNAGFDGSVIAAEYMRLGLKPPFIPSSMICTMIQSTDYCRLSGPYSNKWPKLDELHMFLFGTVFGGAHDAGVDVAACARCFFELVGRGVISIA
jgi:DNA polymerase-3 subunit epsilon